MYVLEMREKLLRKRELVGIIRFSGDKPFLHPPLGERMEPGLKGIASTNSVKWPRPGLIMGRLPNGFGKVLGFSLPKPFLLSSGHMCANMIMERSHLAIRYLF